MISLRALVVSQSSVRVSVGWFLESFAGPGRLRPTLNSVEARWRSHWARP